MCSGKMEPCFRSINVRDSGCGRICASARNEGKRRAHVWEPRWFSVRLRETSSHHANFLVNQHMFMRVSVNICRMLLNEFHDWFINYNYAGVLSFKIMRVKTTVFSEHAAYNSYFLLFGIVLALAVSGFFSGKYTCFFLFQA